MQIGGKIITILLFQNCGFSDMGTFVGGVSHQTFLNQHIRELISALKASFKLSGDKR